MNELLNQGGMVMWIQCVLAFFAIIFVLERLIFFQGERGSTKDLLLGVGNHLRRAAFEEAAHEAGRAPGAAARVAKAVLGRHFLPRTELAQVAEETAVLEMPLIEKNLRGLLGIALLAPLAGLLGTVLGMMEVLSGNEGTPASHAMLAEGLFKSLLTTANGLAVALLAYLCYLWMLGKAKLLLHKLERTGIETVNLVCDARNAKTAGTPEKGKEQPGKKRAGKNEKEKEA